MPDDPLGYWLVFTGRSAKDRPDNKPKNELYEWDQLPALGEMNPE
jgi:hypothetical protein